MEWDTALYVAFAPNIIVYATIELIAFSIPFRRFSRWGNNPNSIQIDTVDIQELDAVSEQLGTRDYVNWANGIAHELREPYQHCRELTDATLEVSLSAMEQLGDRELAQNVRAAAYLPLGEIGHQYLEILEGGEWVPYETTQFTPHLSPDEIRPYSEESRDDKSQINIPKSLQDKVHVRTRPGTQKWRPILKSVAKDYWWKN